MFEEILRQLKILLGGSNGAGLLKIWIKGEQIFLRLRGMQRQVSNIKTFQAVDIFEIARDAEAGVFGE